MKIYPAIDLIGGKVVRLKQGDYNQKTVYSDEPLDVAKKLYDSGARYLHIVDLDGAKSGLPVNFDVIKKLALQSGLKVEVGGGIRDEEKINAYLNLGVDRVILGTVAVKDFDFTKRMAKKYGDKIAVGIDAADGKVAIKGWQEVTQIDALEFCKMCKKAGVKNIIYTDISKDGMESGANLEVYKELLKISGVEFTASGGVTFLDEVRALKEIGVSSVILGKALYTNKISLESAIKEAGEQ